MSQSANTFWGKGAIAYRYAQVAAFFATTLATSRDCMEAVPIPAVLGLPPCVLFVWESAVWEISTTETCEVLIKGSIDQIKAKETPFAGSGFSR